jgi:hypothetical protein
MTVFPEDVGADTTMLWMVFMRESMQASWIWLNYLKGKKVLYFGWAFRKFCILLYGKDDEGILA